MPLALDALATAGPDVPTPCELPEFDAVALPEEEVEVAAPEEVVEAVGPSPVVAPPISPVSPASPMSAAVKHPVAARRTVRPVIFQNPAMALLLAALPARGCDAFTNGARPT